MNTLIAIALGVWKKANCWVLQLERTTPKHEGEDNLAKPNNDWDCEDEDITIQN